MKASLLLLAIVMQASFSYGMSGQVLPDAGQIIDHEEPQNPVPMPEPEEPVEEPQTEGLIINCTQNKFVGVRTETAPGNFDYVPGDFVSTDSITLKEVESDDSVPAGAVTFAADMTPKLRFKFHFYTIDDRDMIENVVNWPGGGSLGAREYKGPGIILNSTARIAGTDPVLVGHYLCQVAN